MKKVFLVLVVMLISLRDIATYNKKLASTYFSQNSCDTSNLNGLIGGVIVNGSAVLKGLIISNDGVTATDDIIINDGADGTALLKVSFPSADLNLSLTNLNINAVNGLYLTPSVSGGVSDIVAIYEQ